MTNKNKTQTHPLVRYSTLPSKINIIAIVINTRSSHLYSHTDGHEQNKEQWLGWVSSFRDEHKCLVFSQLSHLHRGRLRWIESNWPRSCRALPNCLLEHQCPIRKRRRYTEKEMCNRISFNNFWLEFQNKLWISKVFKLLWGAKCQLCLVCYITVSLPGVQTKKILP